MPRLTTSSNVPQPLSLTLTLTQTLTLTLTLSLAGFLVGCQSMRVDDPIDPTIVASQTEEDQMTFWHELASRPLVANDEAFHALLLFVDGKDDSESYVVRVARLKGRKMLPGGFDADADRAITRGDLAVAIVGALNIKGGVMLRLTGASPRYALRELVYQGLFPESSEYQTFTGQQFVGIIGKAEDYQRDHPVKKPIHNTVADDASNAPPY